MNYKGIVFDLDGTLVDTALDLKEGLNHALRSFNFPEASLEQTKDWIGNGMWNLIRKALPESEKSNDSLINTMVLEYLNPYYQKHCVDRSVPYENTIEVLEELKNKDLKLAVISNKPDHLVKQIMATLFPKIEFDFISGHREGFEHKPNPELTLLGIKEMGLVPNEILYIGDSITDYKTAQNAGTDILLIRNGYEDQNLIKELNSKKISNFKEILENV